MIPTFLILDLSAKEVLIASVVLAVIQLTNVKLPHLVRVTDFRKITLPLTVIYLINLTALSWSYSDQTGTKATNDMLSLARATAIYDYLKALLANKALVVTLIGKGFKDPVASNATAAGRAANRRAVVSVG